MPNIPDPGQGGRPGRRYSDGLLKFEPKDVMELQVPTPAFRSDPEAEQVYRLVIDELLTAAQIAQPLLP